MGDEYRGINIGDVTGLRFAERLGGDVAGAIKIVDLDWRAVNNNKSKGNNRYVKLLIGIDADVVEPLLSCQTDSSEKLLNSLTKYFEMLEQYEESCA